MERIVRSMSMSVKVIPVSIRVNVLMVSMASHVTANLATEEDYVKKISMSAPAIPVFMVESVQILLMISSADVDLVCMARDVRQM